MKKEYIIEIIEPTPKLKRFKNQKNWKHLCNFSIDIIKIDIEEYEKGRKNQKN